MATSKSSLTESDIKHTSAGEMPDADHETQRRLAVDASVIGGVVTSRSVLIPLLSVASVGAIGYGAYYLYKKGAFDNLFSGKLSLGSLSASGLFSGKLFSLDSEGKDFDASTSSSSSSRGDEGDLSDIRAASSIAGRTGSSDDVAAESDDTSIDQAV